MNIFLVIQYYSCGEFRSVVSSHSLLENAIEEKDLQEEGSVNSHFAVVPVAFHG